MRAKLRSSGMRPRGCRGPADIGLVRRHAAPNGACKLRPCLVSINMALLPELKSWAGSLHSTGNSEEPSGAVAPDLGTHDPRTACSRRRQSTSAGVRRRALEFLTI